MVTCRVCNSADDGDVFKAREMMYGSKEEFDYYECNACGSIQIVEVPDDLHRFYQNDYWRFARFDRPVKSAVKKWLNRIRSSYWLYEGRNWPGKLLSIGHKKPRFLNWLMLDGVDFNSRILDVGSGPGELVLKIANSGFRNVHGLDPFIDQDINYANGGKVFKNDLEHFSGEYDVIMLHHSLEHMPDPRAVLADLYRLLAPGGWLLIRIPVAGKYAWRKYRENWVQLDPPRHLYLFSVDSMIALAEAVGFSINEVRYDSEPMQFWASEQYLKDIPLFREDSYEVNTEGSMFSVEQIDAYRKQAHQLNADGDGDQAAFFFRKPLQG